MERVILAFEFFLEKISRWGIIFSLFTILGLAVTSIILRWSGVSPMWLEPLIRHLVFLTAFLGGSLATSRKVHIKVDILTRLIDTSTSKVLHWIHKNLISFFCFVTTLVLTLSAYDFYLVEKQFGTHAFLGIHTSFLVGIIPFGMGLICLRFFNQLLLGLFQGDARASNRL